MGNLLRVLFLPSGYLDNAFFVFIEYKKGYALGWSLVAINAIAILIYMVFPVSTYWWRQEFLARPITGFWADQAYSVWASDTSFNCFPSLHAAISTLCFFTWNEYRKIRSLATTNLVAATVLAIAGGAILSTLFIKQHYIADEIAGIALAWIVGRLTFAYLWKTQSNTNKPKTHL